MTEPARPLIDTGSGQAALSLQRRPRSKARTGPTQIHQGQEYVGCRPKAAGIVKRGSLLRAKGVEAVPSDKLLCAGQAARACIAS